MVFQYYNQLFLPEKDIAIGSPNTSNIAENYLQILEELFIKQWMESKI